MAWCSDDTGREFWPSSRADWAFYGSLLTNSMPREWEVYASTSYSGRSPFTGEFGTPPTLPSLMGRIARMRAEISPATFVPTYPPVAPARRGSVLDALFEARRSLSGDYAPSTLVVSPSVMSTLEQRPQPVPAGPVLGRYSEPSTTHTDAGAARHSRLEAGHLV